MTDNAQANTLAAFLDKSLAGTAPSRVVFATLASVVGLRVAYDLAAPGDIVTRFHAAKWRLIRLFINPFIKKTLAKEGARITLKQCDAITFNTLPDKGIAPDQIAKYCRTLKQIDHPTENGECGGTVYHGGPELSAVISDALQVFLWSNPLHADIFCATRQMESQIAAMALQIFHGEARNGEACAAYTSGGSESIMMAIKSTRDYYRHHKGIEHPSMVVPITAHPAFDKAAHYFGIEIIKVPVDSNIGTVDVAELAAYIRADTIVIVGSAPCYSWGTIDPIAELGQLALSRGVGLHVDCCLGGFMVPFLQDAGFPETPIVDFRVPGVTTISADTHKYGYAPKGSSIVLYATHALRQEQYFKRVDWPGGLYASPGAPGSKPGNIIAGTWATMLYMGRSGYVTAARDIRNTALALIAGINKIPTLRVFGNPQASVVAFTSDVLDIWTVGDGLKARGWMLNPLQMPPGIQMSLTHVHTQPGFVERLLADLLAEVQIQYNKLDPNAAGSPYNNSPTLYGSAQKVSDKTIVGDLMNIFLDKYYS